MSDSGQGHRGHPWEMGTQGGMNSMVPPVETLPVTDKPGQSLSNLYRFSWVMADSPIDVGMGTKRKASVNEIETRYP